MKKRKPYILLLCLIFLCNVLTACSGALQPDAPINGQTESLISDRISVKIERMSPYTYRTGSGTHILGKDGVWRWDYTDHYMFSVSLCLKNTGSIPISIDNSIFSTYWDDEKLVESSSTYDNIFTNGIELASDKQSSIVLTYCISEAQYNNWNISGHKIIFKIQYGSKEQTYMYLTGTNEIKEI